MKLRQTQSNKLKLSSTLRSWLPILHSDIESLKETLDEFAKENPFIEIKSANEETSSQKNRSQYFEFYQKKSSTDNIEIFSTSKESLFDTLHRQIEPPLFPTRISQVVAYEIVNNLNDEGYFEGDIEKIAKKVGMDIESVEKIRQRFAHLEPPGIGAIDLKESFKFQLNDFDMDETTYELVTKIIDEFEDLQKFTKHKNYSKAINIIKKFKNPPAIDYKKSDIQIIPDIFIFEHDGEIEVKLNEAYYPEIIIDKNGIDDSIQNLKAKIDEAKSLIDAVEMRKATLYKIALMIVEYQYDFFKGGSIKPMKLKDISSDIDRHLSTVSRAISNKYLACERGIIPIKKFFATTLCEENDISNAQIKEYIQTVIKNEDKQKPLSDNKILTYIKDKFSVDIGRRTVAKYRIQLNIASSSERKKLYALNNTKTKL